MNEVAGLHDLQNLSPKMCLILVCSHPGDLPSFAGRLSEGSLNLFVPQNEKETIQAIQQRKKHKHVVLDT